jgi:hypothetical protein
MDPQNVVDGQPVCHTRPSLVRGKVGLMNLPKSLKDPQARKL